MRELVSTRQIAFEVLYDVLVNQKYSNIILPQRLNSTSFESRDKAFITELVYGTLRQQGFCDAAIRAFSDRDISKIDMKVLIVLRLGVYQLLILKSSNHAAVSESVELAKTVSGKSTAGFVNAVLRRVSENLDFAPSEHSERYSHPRWIIDSYKDALKSDDQVLQQLISNNEPASPTLVAWPGLSSIEEIAGEGAVPIAGSKSALSYSGNPGNLSAVRERRAGVQDLGSQLVVENFLETDTGGLSWLDMCAGPGGKAAYLDSSLFYGERDAKSFVANEISSERAKLVKQVVRNGKVTNFDARTLKRELTLSEGTFDRILIDAPCTGIGALRRRPEVRWRRTPKDLPSLTQLQSELLASAVTLLKPGGIIGYATCSPHLAETKWQIRSFLKANENFQRIPVTKFADSDGDMQLWTFRDGTDSMFLSLLQSN